LDIALLTVFQGFRKVYIGEQVVHSSKVRKEHSNLFNISNLSLPCHCEPEMSCPVCASVDLSDMLTEVRYCCMHVSVRLADMLYWPDPVSPVSLTYCLMPALVGQSDMLAWPDLLCNKLLLPSIAL